MSDRCVSGRLSNGGISEHPTELVSLLRKYKNNMKTGTNTIRLQIQYWTPKKERTNEKKNTHTHTKKKTTEPEKDFLFPLAGHLNAHPVPLCFADFPSQCSPPSPSTELKIKWCFKTYVL